MHTYLYIWTKTVILYIDPILYIRAVGVNIKSWYWILFKSHVIIFILLTKSAINCYKNKPAHFLRRLFQVWIPRRAPNSDFVPSSDNVRWLYFVAVYISFCMKNENSHEILADEIPHFKSKLTPWHIKLYMRLHTYVVYAE